jgi:hypothetical protein
MQEKLDGVRAILAKNERDLKDHQDAGGIDGDNHYSANDTIEEATQRRQVAQLRAQLLERAAVARRMKAEVIHNMATMREQHSTHAALLSTAKAQSQQLYDQLVHMKQTAAQTEEARKTAMAALIKGDSSHTPFVPYTIVQCIYVWSY